MALFNIETWLSEISSKIRSAFGSRVLFIGCHGSYSRGEATENSDVDMVVILDKLSFDDLKKYRELVVSMPYSEKACGFVAGREELEAWPKADMFQLVFETRTLFGDLSSLVSPLTDEDIAAAVKNGAGNIYHAACHSFLYDKDLVSSLRALYKMAFFVLQAGHYLKCGRYIRTKKELLPQLAGEDKDILQACLDRRDFTEYPPLRINDLYEKLIRWSADCLKGSKNDS